MEKKEQKLEAEAGMGSVCCHTLQQPRKSSENQENIWPPSTGTARVGTGGCQREHQKVGRVDGDTEWPVPHKEEDRLSKRRVR